MILRYHFVERWGVHTIAAQLKLHHSTVDRVISQAGLPKAQRTQRASILHDGAGTRWGCLRVNTMHAFSGDRIDWHIPRHRVETFYNKPQGEEIRSSVKMRQAASENNLADDKSLAPEFNDEITF